MFRHTMSNYATSGPPSSHGCNSYCNQTGHYSDGFSCGFNFCCGNLTNRVCCGNASLDISTTYPDKCNCPASSCSKPSWDILLPCVAAALFVFLMITICCCQGCRRGTRCRQWLHRRFLGPETEASDPESSVVNMGAGQDTGIDPSFPHLPPYEFGPPKYDSLELTEAPPKYEEAMREQQEPQNEQQQQQQQHYDNIAFVGDGSAADGDVTPDVARRSSVTHGCSGTPDRNSPHDGDSLATRRRAETENDCGGGTPQRQGHTHHGHGHTPQGQGHIPQRQDRTPHGQGHTHQGQGHIPQGQGHTPKGQGHNVRPKTSVGSHSETSFRLQPDDRDSGSSSVPQITSSGTDLETPGSCRLQITQGTSNDQGKIDSDQSIV